MREALVEPRSTDYRKYIVAIQKDNAANILGALGADCVDYFYLL